MLPLRASDLKPNSDEVFIQAVFAKLMPLSLEFQKEASAEFLAKPDGSPVTWVDKNNQWVVREVLRHRAPVDQLIGEEELEITPHPRWKQALEELLAEIPALEAAKLGQWTMDPIDGTLGFIMERGFAIAISCLRDGVRSSGAAFPGSDLLGAGAPAVFVTAQEGVLSVEPISSAPAVFPRPVVLSFPRAGRRDFLFESLSPVFPIVQMDGQGKYACVAAGKAQAFVKESSSKGTSYIWDHAAGVHLVQAAGGVVIDFEGKEVTVPYDSRSFKVAGGIIAAVDRSTAERVRAQVLSLNRNLPVDLEWSRSHAISGASNLPLNPQPSIGPAAKSL